MYTIDRVGFASLCCDLYTTFLDELEKAFNSTGLLYSQIDTVFALGESQNNHKIREFIVENFSGKVQFEQTDAERRNSAIMEKWQMYEHLSATAWFSDSQWKCSSFVWNGKCIELSCPTKYTHSTYALTAEICK